MRNMLHFPGKGRKPVTSSSSDGAELGAVVSLRDRMLIQGWMIVIALLAWAYLFYLSEQMDANMAREAMPAPMAMPDMSGMAGMSIDRPWNAVDMLFAFVMWLVMMVGMMAGSTIPVMLLFAGAQASRGRDKARLMVSLFGLGYGIVWAGFSVVAALAQWALHDAAMLSSSMAASSPTVGAAVLCAAGLYQLTPFKQACLVRCRSPLGFILVHWRDGRLGAVKMGIRHGAYCLGCCWALMTVLFVVGIMNLVWVALLSLFVILEKFGPAGSAVSRVAGVVMIAAGTFMFFRM